MFIWSMLEKFLDKGISVVILSLNLSDSLAMADRLLNSWGKWEKEGTLLYRGIFQKAVPAWGNPSKAGSRDSGYA